MQKWGIPTKEKVAPEATLLERLVWVRFDEHWWPALLYENYTELQDHMYKQLDVVTKAQFASAIMRHLNNPQKIKIARLLGKERLEVVEVQDHEYAEFYWQLSQVLPMACRKSNYGGDTKLYLEFHRALDQVEQIIRDLTDAAVKMTRESAMKNNRHKAQDAAEERILDALLPPAKDNWGQDVELSDSNTRQLFRKKLREGLLDDKKIEIDVAQQQVGIEIMSPPGMEEMTNQLQGLFQNMGGDKRKTRKLKIKDAFKLLVEDSTCTLNASKA